MKLIEGVMIVLLIVIGFCIFTKIPSETFNEVSKIALEPPMIFIGMFLLIIAIIFVGYGFFMIQLPRFAGREKEADKNLKKLKNFLNKLKFWKFFTQSLNSESEDKA